MLEKILVVDDELLGRGNLCKFLGSEGYEISEASNGFEALRLLEGENFDLVIADFLMPDVDGLRLTNLISDKWPQLPVILITGYLTTLAKIDMREGTVANIFTKPVKLGELLNTIKQILESKH